MTGPMYLMLFLLGMVLFFVFGRRFLRPYLRLWWLLFACSGAGFSAGLAVSIAQRDMLYVALFFVFCLVIFATVLGVVHWIVVSLYRLAKSAHPQVS